MYVGVQARLYDVVIHRMEVASLQGWVYPGEGGQHWRYATRGRLNLRVTRNGCHEKGGERRVCNCLGSAPRCTVEAGAGGIGYGQWGEHHPREVQLRQ